MSAALQMSPTAATSNAPAIVLDKVNKWYGSIHVLRDISLTVGHKERVVVCGPSGSGKSSLIAVAAGLESKWQKSQLEKSSLSYFSSCTVDYSQS